MVVEGVPIELVDLPGDAPAAARDGGAAAAAAAPVVLVHGLGASWPVWLAQLPAFAAAGHRVVAFDLPGFGGSGMPAGAEISVAGYARTAAGVIEAIGLGPVHVIGHSLGGFVAAELALRRPELVDHVVLAAPAVLWREYRRSGPLVALAGAAAVAERRAGALRRAAAGRRAGASRADVRAASDRPGAATLGGAAAVPVPRRPRLRAAVLGASGIHVPQRVPPEFQTELLRIARPTPGYLAALRALRGLDLRPELGRIAAPALLAWGDRDTLVGVEQLAAMRELLPHAQTLVLERTGHRLMIERPDAFNAAVLAFLATGGAAPSRTTLSP